MKLKIKAGLLLSLIFVLGLFIALPAFGATGEPFTITSDTGKQKDQLKTFNELKAMFDNKDLTLDDIKKKYTETLQKDVVPSNAEIDQKIIFVLDAAIKGQMTAGQAKQAVDKGLQWFFYNEITNFTKTVVPAALAANKTDEAMAALDQALELYKGSLRGTAEKRDTKFNTGTKDLMDTVVIPRLQKAVADKDVQTYNETRQMLDKTVIKVFVLAITSYAEKIPQEKDVQKNLTAITEGYFFYMPIFNSLKGGSAADAEYVDKALGSGDPTKINYEDITKAFIKAMNGKISGYVEKTIVSATAGDLAKARITAMEGNMFVAAQEIFIKNKLGAEAYTEITKHGQLYFEAVAAGNIAQAQLHSFNVLQILAKLDGVNFTIGTKELTVNGGKKSVDVASYVDAKSNRTLVPTRFIAEALGLTVNWIAETKTVIIEGNGNKIELVVNSDVVVKNGKKEDKKLDQPVIIKNGRSFIPLRAVAELMGNKVFYSEGKVAVLK